MTNARAESLLTDLGFQCEEEPDWVTEGPVPDFFCRGPFNMWAEVKTFGLTKRIKSLGDVNVELRGRVEKLKLTSGGGRAIASVSLPLDGRDARAVTELMARELRRGVTQEFVATVPRDPIYHRFVNFEVRTDNGRVVKVVSLASDSGKYDLPFTMMPEPYLQQTVIHSTHEVERTVHLRDLWTGSDNYRVALEVTPGPETLRLFCTGHTGMATESGAVDRLRSAVERANIQLKNGCRFEEVPGLLLVYDDDIDVAEDRVVASALFGNLVYTAPRNDWASGELQRAQDGAWHSKKHRTMSALCYVRSDSERVTAYNPWAARQLPHGLFGGREVVLNATGEIEITDDAGGSNTSVDSSS